MIITNVINLNLHYEIFCEVTVVSKCSENDFNRISRGLKINLIRFLKKNWAVLGFVILSICWSLHWPKNKYHLIILNKLINLKKQSFHVANYLTQQSKQNKKAKNYNFQNRIKKKWLPVFWWFYEKKSFGISDRLCNLFHADGLTPNFFSVKCKFWSSHPGCHARSEMPPYQIGFLLLYSHDKWK